MISGGAFLAESDFMCNARHEHKGKERQESQDKIKDPGWSQSGTPGTIRDCRRGLQGSIEALRIPKGSRIHQNVVKIVWPVDIRTAFDAEDGRSHSQNVVKIL